MSDSTNDPSDNQTGDDGMPEGIAPPPPPDIIDTKNQGPTYTDGKSDRKGEKKGRRHPTDAYEPLKQRKSCGGCCGCFVGAGALVVLLFAGLAAAIAYFGPGKPIVDGYEVVTLEEEEVTITEAPSAPTYYIGQVINYNVPLTEHPVAILGVDVTVSGDFYENTTITGSTVVGTPTARFAKDLEIYAAEFKDEGITLKGELKGRVIESTQ